MQFDANVASNLLDEGNVADELKRVTQAVKTTDSNAASAERSAVPDAAEVRRQVVLREGETATVTFAAVGFLPGALELAKQHEASPAMLETGIEIGAESKRAVVTGQSFRDPPLGKRGFGGSQFASRQFAREGCSGVAGAVRRSGERICECAIAKEKTATHCPS